MDNCTSCTWYEDGYCKRFPPQIHWMGMEAIQVHGQLPDIANEVEFPMVRDHVCGEYMNDELQEDS